ncbi:MAG: YraN family protein [Brevefilum sp.]
MTYQKRIGNLGESIAADFLTDHGYQLMDKNFSTPYGELDLVFDDLGQVVFVEVKTRTSDTFGNPETSITEIKLERIQNAALLWLQAHPEIRDDWRMDVIAILLDAKGNVRDIQHFINVII